VAFAPNDERSAKRLSDALGTSTELRAQTNLSGKRLSAWLSHTSISEQETPRPLLTPGEVLQLPPDEALVLASGVPPIRARKLKYYADRNFLARRLPAPALGTGRRLDAPAVCGDDWSGHVRSADARLDKPWSELVTSSPGDEEESRPLARKVPKRKREKDKDERPLSDLPLFAAGLAEPQVESEAPAAEALDKVIQFPGLRL
jgi:type IV secretion system protein VirD4